MYAWLGVESWCATCDIDNEDGIFQEWVIGGSRSEEGSVGQGSSESILDVSSCEGSVCGDGVDTTESTESAVSSEESSCGDGGNATESTQSAVRSEGSVCGDGVDVTESPESAVSSTDVEIPAVAQMEESRPGSGRKKRGRKGRSGAARKKKNKSKKSVESEKMEKVYEQEEKEDNEVIVDRGPCVSWYKAFGREMEICMDRWNKTSESHWEWLRKFMKTKY